MLHPVGLKIQMVCRGTSFPVLFCSSCTFSLCQFSWRIGYWKPSSGHFVTWVLGAWGYRSGDISLLLKANFSGNNQYSDLNPFEYTLPQWPLFVGIWLSGGVLLVNQEGQCERSTGPRSLSRWMRRGRSCQRRGSAERWKEWVVSFGTSTLGESAHFLESSVLHMYARGMFWNVHKLINSNCLSQIKKNPKSVCLYISH